MSDGLKDHLHTVRKKLMQLSKEDLVVELLGALQAAVDIKKDSAARIASLEAQLADSTDKVTAWNKIAEKNARIEALEAQLAEARKALDVAAADLVGCCKDPEAPFVAEAVRRICDAKIAASPRTHQRDQDHERTAPITYCWNGNGCSRSRVVSRRRDTSRASFPGSDQEAPVAQTSQSVQETISAERHPTMSENNARLELADELSTLRTKLLSARDLSLLGRAVAALRSSAEPVAAASSGDGQLLRHHLERLANTKMDMSMLVWNTISNDILRIADSLAARPRVHRAKHSHQPEGKSFLPGVR